MEYIIGVDIGTTNTKAIAVDVHGDTHDRFELPNATLNPMPGHYEQNAETLFQTIKTCIAHVAHRMSGRYPAAKALAVSFSSAMHGVMALDDSHQPLTNCMLWSDSRSAAIASELKGTELGQQLYAHTGTPIHAMSPLCKLAWMKAHMPDVHARAARFVSIKEYVFFRLFGEFVVDFSIASATGLFDVHHCRWYAPALAYAGIGPSQLSTPVPISYGCSGLRPADAATLGIAPHTSFIVGGSDGCLANLGVGAIEPGVAAVTVGTSGAVRVAQQVPAQDPAARVFSYMLTPELHIVGGAVNNGGNVLQWFLGSFGGAGEDVNRDVASFIARADAVGPGADGVVFLPYLLGERAPLWDASAKGAYFGLRMHHGQEHLARATLEGVVYGLYHVAQAVVEQAGPITQIHATGGFFESEFCVQLLADVFATPVQVRDDADGSALGAVVTALFALGYLPELKLAGPNADTKIYKPDSGRHKQYAQAFDRYLRLVDRLKEEFF